MKLFAGVKRLSAHNWWLKLLGQKDVASEQFALNNLRHLELKTGFTKYNVLGIAALLDIAPNLNTMVLTQCFMQEENESLLDKPLSSPMNLRIPNLKKIELRVFEESEDLSIVLQLFKKFGVVLEKIVVVPAQPYMYSP